MSDIKDKIKEKINDHAVVAKAREELYINNKEKGVLDSIQEKLVSRTLLVFVVSTALLMYAGLDADIWGMIAVCYIGGQSAIDFAKSWKHGG